MAQAQLKRWFTGLYVTANSLLLTRGLRRMRSQPLLTTGGSIAAHGAPLVFLVSLYALRRGRTSERLLVLRSVVGLGAVASLAEHNDRGPRARGAAIAGVLATELYVRWYSRLGRRASVDLATGGRLPDDLRFVDLDGGDVTAADLRGRPIALFFYRGNWCPLCVAQVREMAERWQELDALGVDVVLISPQSDEQSRELAERFGVRFRYLSDPGLTSARRLGLVHEDGVPLGIPGYDPDTVFPTVLVLGADGTILFSDQTDNYRVRPEPQTIIQALRDAARPVAA